MKTDPEALRIFRMKLMIFFSRTLRHIECNTVVRITQWKTHRVNNIRKGWSEDHPRNGQCIKYKNNVIHLATKRDRERKEQVTFQFAKKRVKIRKLHAFLCVCKTTSDRNEFDSIYFSWCMAISEDAFDFECRQRQWQILHAHSYIAWMWENNNRSSSYGQP